MFLTEFGEKTKTYFMFNIFSPKNCVTYEITWNNMIEPDRSQMLDI